MNTLYKCNPHNNTGDNIAPNNILEKSRPKVRELVRDTAQIKTQICPLELSIAPHGLSGCVTVNFVLCYRCMSAISWGYVRMILHIRQAGWSQYPRRPCSCHYSDATDHAGETGTCVRHQPQNIHFITAIPSLAATSTAIQH